jgi:hypothetical protein
LTNPVLGRSNFLSASNLGELTIWNGSGENAVAKVIDARTDQKVHALWITAGARGDIGRIPDGSYKLLFAFGKSLVLGSEDKLASTTGCCRFDSPMVFVTVRDGTGVVYKTVSVTLNPVANGNAQTSPVSQAEFDRY